MALSRSKKIEKLSAAFAQLPDSARILLQHLADKGVGQDAQDVLAFFNRIARRLPKDQRTVTAFTAPQSLAQAISQSVQDWALPQLAARTAAQEWNKVINPAAKDEFRLLAIANALSAADPDNLRSVPQIIRWLQTDTNRALPEDLPGIKADLKAFKRIKPDLAPDARDVTAYPHIHDLRATLPKTAYSQDQRKAYEAQALQNRDAKLLWQDENNNACLIHITSELGAQRLGRGTDWCTAWGGPGDPDKKSKFSEYSDNLLYWRIGAEVYQVHFSSEQFKGAQDQNIELKSLVTACPEAVPALKSALEQALQNAAKEGYGTDIAQVLTACKNTDNVQLLETAISALTPAHLDQIFQKAVEYGWEGSIDHLLTTCQNTGDQGLLQAAISALTPHLDQTFQGLAQYAWGDYIAQLLTACQNTGHAQFLETAISALIPVLDQTFQTAAQSGKGDHIAQLLTACQHTGDANLLETAISALTPACLYQTLQDAAKTGLGHDIAQLLTACQNTGNVQLLETAISTLTPAHLKQTFGMAVLNQREYRVAQLLTACHDINHPELTQTVRTALAAPEIKTQLEGRSQSSSKLKAAMALWDQPKARPSAPPQPSLGL